ncbi:hypothetical protein [Myxosarcina sp. GI1(2024)]
MREKHSVFIVPPLIREVVTNQFIAQIGGNFSPKNRQKLIFSTKKPIELHRNAKQPTPLSQWLQNCFEPDWQPVEVIFAALAKFPSRLRSGFNLREETLVKRFKQIELATNKSPTKVLLLVAINRED